MPSWKLYVPNFYYISVFKPVVWVPPMANQVVSGGICGTPGHLTTSSNTLNLTQQTAVLYKAPKHVFPLSENALSSSRASYWCFLCHIWSPNPGVIAHSSNTLNIDHLRIQLRTIVGKHCATLYKAIA